MENTKRIVKNDIFNTNEGGHVIVIDYIDSKNVLIEHLDFQKHRVTVRAEHLRTGRISNPYKPSVQGVGYIGVGPYLTSERGKNNPAYRTWARMFERAYCDKYHSRYPTYTDCSVDTTWHNFQNFAEWFYKQPHAGEEGFALDKDLIILGNKTYNKDACSFVPTLINSLLTDSAAARGELPLGVKRNFSGYQARLSMYGERKCLGTFPTIEAAYLAYKEAKQDYVYKLANEYKDVLHPDVYKTLITWKLPCGGLSYVPQIQPQV